MTAETRVDVLCRNEDVIHRWSCRFANEDRTWNYWLNEGAWIYISLQELIATNAHWLRACRVCKPTGWTA